jgi:hypothetical protein
VEPLPNSKGFIGTVFDVPVSEEDIPLVKQGLPSRALVKREQSYRIVPAPFLELTTDADEQNDSLGASVSSIPSLEDASTVGSPSSSFSSVSLDSESPVGLLCTQSTDHEYVLRWGAARFQEQFGQFGLSTIWHWPYNSGIRPCGVYLRHCYLAAQGHGEPCLSSFLDDTYLVDRTTTIRTYLLDQHPEILQLQPPPALELRYNG